MKNVPTSATLSVVVRDKDIGAAIDDYIGKFDVGISPGAKGVEIQGPMNMRNRGTFWLKVMWSTVNDPTTYSTTHRSSPHRPTMTLNVLTICSMDQCIIPVIVRLGLGR